MSWDGLAEWWTTETEADPTYVSHVVPLVSELLPAAGLFLDAGCGEGQVSRLLKSNQRLMIGCDVNQQLCLQARSAMPVVRAQLPDLAWLKATSVDGVFLTLVIEHLDDLDSIFLETLTVSRPGGCLIIVANHPIVTAPGSANILDPEDGEVFWRPGQYLTAGQTEERAGDAKVTFYHRPLADILNAAAQAGWVLDAVREQPLPNGTPDSGVPRLLGLRWTKPVEVQSRYTGNHATPSYI